MGKRIVSIGFWTGVFMATAIVAYAVTKSFFTQSITSDFSKKVIFQFDLNKSMRSGEIGSGDSFDVDPVIHNDATEEMYVFVKIHMPEGIDFPLYTFQVDEAWTIVESSGGTVVYAYGTEEMTLLYPGESTSALTKQMTMKEMSNAEYAAIEDINFTITGYAIGTEDMVTDPAEAWNHCKIIGDIE